MIIIDTHILLWWKLNDDSLSLSYRQILDNPNEIIGVSAVSLMEIICLYDRQRINLPEIPELWIARIMAEPRIIVIPISANIAIDAFRLPDKFHKDPADRLIVASARVRSPVGWVEERNPTSPPIIPTILCVGLHFVSPNLL